MFEPPCSRDGSRPRPLQLLSPPGTASNKKYFRLPFTYVRRVILIQNNGRSPKVQFRFALPTRLLSMTLDFLGGDGDQNTYVGSWLASHPMSLLLQVIPSNVQRCLVL